MFLAALPGAALAAGAEIWVTHLTGSEMRSALAQLFNDPDMEYARSMRCHDYRASLGRGYDTQITIYRVCRASIDAKDWGRLLSKIGKPLAVEAVAKTTKVMCPYDGEFDASRVHFTSKTLSSWDIEDTAIYVNDASTEVLACQKHLLLM